MLEKDQFEQFFSDAFANQTESVRPELWNGLQAKMATAGVTSTVASKSVGILTKWILGSIAVGSAATISTLVLFNNNEADKKATFSQNLNHKIENTTISKTEELKNNAPRNSTVVLNSSEEKKEINYNFEIPSLIHEAKEILDRVVETKDLTKEFVATVVTQNSSTSSNENTKEDIIDNEANDNSNETTDIASENTTVELESKVNLPNVFTPNGDGENDVYKALNIENISNFHVQIMNEKNQIVFESNDPNFSWDGRTDGDIQKNKVFACIVTGINPQGKGVKKIQLFEIQ